MNVSVWHACTVLERQAGCAVSAAGRTEVGRQPPALCGLG